MYAIESKALTKKFNGIVAVDELCLNVPEGSIYGFLGPNGAGKTTTIKMLTGLSKPTNGMIKICGKEVSFGSLKNRRDIGFLPDVPNFYDWMRPEEFLIFTGELFSIDKKVLNKRIENILELVGLSGVKKRIGSFSRGMKQRLGIAQALINEPKVVFLDEPTSALDPIGRKEVMDVILKLSGKMTVFLSSHILTDIERVCDRVVIIDKGKEMIEDTIINLRQRFAKKGIELELKEGSNLEAFIEIINKQQWLESVTNEGSGELILYANNMNEAQVNIPRILSENNLALKKFSLLEPTLEDIFMKVVNK
jgi:ABC-2 type transport system ATP-binding protein